MSNTKKIEYDFYFKPVLLGYDKNYCSYSNWEVKIGCYYILFFSIVKSTITIIKNERN
jgi:hypothetical protein